MRIVFFGTPDFAVPALRALLGEAFNVVAVVTQPDRARGRSRSVLHPPPIKVVAESEGVPVLQPESPNTPEFLEQLRELAPGIGIVVAYGHILPPELLSVPEHGLINVHASLLPALRGAAPIQHAVIEGLEETGVTIMRLDEGMDTGPMLLKVPTPIATDETAGELEVRLAELGALALVEALSLMAAEALTEETQDAALATYAPKLNQEMARVRWEEPAVRVGRLIRGLDPRPGAWTTLDGHRLKVFGPRLAGFPAPAPPPGEIIETDPAFVVSTGDGALQVLDVQPEGRPRMAAGEWLRGRGPARGAQFV